jgi:hypothetical protein
MEMKYPAALVLSFSLGLAFLLPAGSTDEVIVGTSDGEIMEYQGDHLERIAELDGTIHTVEKDEDDIYASVEKSDSYSVVQADGNFELNLEQPGHGFTVTENHVFVGLQETGSLLKAERDTGEVLDSVNLSGGPHYVEKHEESLFTGNINGTVSRVDPGSMEVEEEFRAGNWLGGLDVRDGNVYTASRAEFPDSNQKSEHNVTKGAFYSFEDSKRRIDLGISTVPHGIAVLQDGKILLTDMTSGSIIYIEDGNVERRKLWDGSGRFFTSELATGEQTYVGDIEKEEMVVLNSELEPVGRESIDGLHTISVY